MFIPKVVKLFLKEITFYTQKDITKMSPINDKRKTLYWYNIEIFLNTSARILVM